MTKLLFLIFSLFFIHQSVFAYSFYEYDKTALKIEDKMFERYVRPQARSIISEYYLLLKKIHPTHGDLILISNKISDLYHDWSKWVKNCHVINAECAKDIKQFYAEARSIELLILKVQKDKIVFTGPESLIFLDEGLLLINHISTLQNSCYKIIHLFEELLVISNEPYFNSKNVPEEIDTILFNMELISEQTITNQVRGSFADDFISLYVNYIKNMQLYIVNDRNPDYLVTRLEEFNIAWNSFHMKLLKSNTPAAKQLLIIVTTMHQRWNSILKIVLK